ncbi:MAG TPA: hypothetical protein VI451_13150 [Anaerolineales bacterium]|nr:hypothetical protein [Anaerolineales bacterium]
MDKILVSAKATTKDFRKRDWLDSPLNQMYDSWMKKYAFRPGLTDDLPTIQALADQLNEESVLTMSLTDAVKIAIELACKNVLPDVRIEKKRKFYQTSGM